MNEFVDNQASFILELDTCIFTLKFYQVGLLPNRSYHSFCTKSFPKINTTKLAEIAEKHAQI